MFVDKDGHKRLIGRADVPDDGLPVFEVSLFGAAFTIEETYALGTVTTLPDGGGVPVVERGIVLSGGQRRELLPGWTALAS